MTHSGKEPLRYGAEILYGWYEVCGASNSIRLGSSSDQMPSNGLQLELGLHDPTIISNNSQLLDKLSCDFCKFRVTL